MTSLVNFDITTVWARCAWKKTKSLLSRTHMVSFTCRVTVLGVAALSLPSSVGAQRPPRSNAAAAETTRWFQSTEQALMDSIGAGDKSPWHRVMDPSCIVTTEEGELLNKHQFLDELRPLPKGLTGRIAVNDLNVQTYISFAVVRYRADEREAVFGQTLKTSYRVTNTYRRDGSEWKMVASQQAVVTRDPPEQPVSKANWPALAGKYRLLPDGWTFTVQLRNGDLYGGRDPGKLRRLVPLAPDAFVASGTLGEWIFVVEGGRATRIVNIRKFEPLIWTRVED